MKKLFFIFFLFFITQVKAQFQPMSILPEAMQSAAGFNSLCMDLFADAPTSKAVYDVPGGGTILGRTSRGDYRHMDIRGASLSGDKPTFVLPRGSTNKVLDSRLQEFVTLKIDHYNTPEFKTSPAMQRRLQNEVWTYNILESKGYLSHTGDVVADYDNGVKTFKRDYGINGPGVSKIVEIGETEHVFKKAGLALDIEDSYVTIKSLELYNSVRFKYISHDLNYKGEKNIILRNKDGIIEAVTPQFYKNGRNMRLEIKPRNHHANHDLIIHVKGQADMSIPLSDNNHGDVYRPSATISSMS